MTISSIVLLFTTVMLAQFASANFDLYRSEPKVSVSSPIMNAVYSQSTINLEVKVEMDSHFIIAHEKIMWIQYSFDGQPGVNLTVKSELNSYGSFAYAKKALTNLSSGVHSISIYGQTILSDYSNGEPLSNFTVTNYFIIEKATPVINVLSPKPKTYDSTSMLLEYKSDTSLSWAGFSLDNNQVITSLATLSLNNLLNGAHTVRMYGNDSAGHLYTSQTVDFTVKDHDAPIVQIDADAIANRTAIFQQPYPEVFNWTNLQLVFEVNEPTPWISYSLDDNANKTIYGNSTIAHLFYGSHKIIVYAKDNAGNIGTSEVYSFNLTNQGINTATLTPNNTPLSILPIAVIATAAVAVACVGSVIYIKKLLKTIAKVNA